MGLTLSAFARQCGLSVSRLRRWKKRLEAGDGPRFHPVEILESLSEPDPIDDSAIEVVVGRRRVVSRRGFDPLALRELVAVLEAC